FLLPPQHSSDNKKPCLVLDLDETLVCSSFNPVPNADFIIPIDIEGEWHNVYVLKRPHVDSFLKRLGSEFEVVVFTASLSNYANPVLDALDVSGVIRYRLFREHCTYYQGNYVKDLSLLGRSLESTIIIDNSPVAYLFHPANAIPCTSWFEDPADEELSDLVPFLQELKTVPDVRAVLGVEPEDDDEAAMAY
ncbi:HAD-like domain-containing protein, partial [Chytriomyces sp. MP71]